MDNLSLDTVNLLTKLHSQLSAPFYTDWKFIVSSLVSIIGAGFAFFAFIEARKAKHAATEAGTTVKMQTITIEVTEIVQRLDSLDINIDFPTTRDLLNEISRKIRRLVSPFESQPDFAPKIGELKIRP